MSLCTLLGFPRSGLGLLVDVAGQVLVAAAAAAGVMAVAGCSSRGGGPPVSMAPAPSPTTALPGNRAGPSMSSPLSPPADTTLFDPPPAPGGANLTPTVLTEADWPGARPGTPRGAVEPPASAREMKRARQAEIEGLLAEASAPPPGPAARGTVALRVAGAAVAPLADTLLAVDAAQRVVVDNLRNAEAYGFKASRTACGDGRDVTAQVDTAQGELQQTRRLLDVAVKGEGFLQVQVYTPDHPAGRVGFTRNGHLFVAKDGTLVVGKPDGYKLIPPLTLPVGTTEVKVDPDGAVRALQAGAEKAVPQSVGRLTLVRFTDPTALQPLGGGVYAETDSSGAAVESPAGDHGTGMLIQGYVEASNVDLVRERLRLRFLQGWRATVLAAVDGETAGEDGVPAGAGRPRGQEPAYGSAPNR